MSRSGIVPPRVSITVYPLTPTDAPGRSFLRRDGRESDGPAIPEEPPRIDSHEPKL